MRFSGYADSLRLYEQLFSPLRLVLLRKPPPELSCLPSKRDGRISRNKCATESNCATCLPPRNRRCWRRKQRRWCYTPSIHGSADTWSDRGARPCPAARVSALALLLSGPPLSARRGSFLRATARRERGAVRSVVRPQGPVSVSDAIRYACCPPSGGIRVSQKRGGLSVVRGPQRHGTSALGTEFDRSTRPGRGWSGSVAAVLRRAPRPVVPGSRVSPVLQHRGTRISPFHSK